MKIHWGTLLLGAAAGTAVALVALKAEISIKFKIAVY